MKRKMVCRLLRSIYELKQASRVWNIQFHEFLNKIGFKQFNADTCLYVNTKLGITIAIWVDDIPIAGRRAQNIAKVEKQLAGAFTMKDLGELSHFLGMRVESPERQMGTFRSTSRRTSRIFSLNLGWRIQKEFAQLLQPAQS